MLNTSYGFQGMLKDGYRHYVGLEEAILRNIEACKAITEITKTSYGPNGMQKLIVNHIDKIFVSNDAATILQEINVHHPAANLIVLASKMQKDDFGDNTNYVVTLAGELISQAESLLKMGLHPSDVIQGFEIGLKKCLEILETLVSVKVTDPKDEVALKVIESVLASKLPNNYKFFAKLVYDGCQQITQEQGQRFNDDSFRVCKILGSDIQESCLLKGFVINRQPESSGKEIVNKAKVACFNCPFNLESGETKGTVLVQNADDLMKFSSSEENQAEKLVKGIVELGANAVVVGGTISELCLHYLNKYGLMVMRIPSKFELMRLCRLLNATALPTLKVPTQDDLGYCDQIHVKEIGSTVVTQFIKDQVNTNLATLILRGATTAQMDNLSRALENGVSAYKQLLSDGRYVNGASSSECFLVNQIESYANTLTGLEQYGCLKFGQAFEVFGNILLDNAGLDSNKLLSELVSKNIEKAEWGVDVFEGQLAEMKDLKVLDSYACKLNAIKLASKAALTVLRIDQIIMAKPAGGPKPKSTSGWDND